MYFYIFKTAKEEKNCTIMIRKSRKMLTDPNNYESLTDEIQVNWASQEFRYRRVL